MSDIRDEGSNADENAQNYGIGPESMDVSVASCQGGENYMNFQDSK